MLDPGTSLAIVTLALETMKVFLAYYEPCIDADYAV